MNCGRLDERWGVETSAKGGRFKLNRDLAGYHLTARAEIASEHEESSVRIIVPSPDRLKTPGALIHFDAVSLRYKTSTKPLLANVTFTVDQGARCAFIGANGQGKSTLARMIAGTTIISSGSIVRHPSLSIGVFGQHAVEDLTRAATSEKCSALSYFLNYQTKKGIEVAEQEARACLGSFGLTGKLATGDLLVLSGGQKVR